MRSAAPSDVQRTGAHRQDTGSVRRGVGPTRPGRQPGCDVPFEPRVPKRCERRGEFRHLSPRVPDCEASTSGRCGGRQRLPFSTTPSSICLLPTRIRAVQPGATCGRLSDDGFTLRPGAALQHYHLAGVGPHHLGVKRTVLPPQLFQKRVRVPRSAEGLQRVCDNGFYVGRGRIELMGHLGNWSALQPQEKQISLSVVQLCESLTQDIAADVPSCRVTKGPSTPRCSRPHRLHPLPLPSSEGRHPARAERAVSPRQVTAQRSAPGVTMAPGWPALAQ